MSETLLHQNEPDPFETEEEYQERLTLEEKAKKRQEAYMDALHRVLNTYEGRHVLWEVLSKSRMFLGPPSHPQDTFRELGRADVGRELIMDLEDCKLDAFSEIYSEASKREKEWNEDG